MLIGFLTFVIISCYFVLFRAISCPLACSIRGLRPFHAFLALTIRAFGFDNFVPLALTVSCFGFNFRAVMASPSCRLASPSCCLASPSCRLASLSCRLASLSCLLGLFPALVRHGSSHFVPLSSLSHQFTFATFSTSWNLSF